jgi:hypothetical protein
MFTSLFHKKTGVGLQRTNIDTASASKMHDFTEMMGDDIEILKFIYDYNPFVKSKCIIYRNLFLVSRIMLNQTIHLT